MIGTWTRRRQLFNLKNPSRLQLSLKTIWICPECHLGVGFAAQVLAIAREIARFIAFSSESFRNPDEADNCCQGQHAALRHRYPSLLPSIERFSLTRESRRFAASHHRRAADRGQWRKAADGRNVFLFWIIPTFAVDTFTAVLYDLEYCAAPQA